jgi:hypothetical protein
VDAEAKHSIIQGQHLDLRYRPQKQSMPTRSSSMGPTVESGPLTGNSHPHHRKEEKNYLHKLDQQGKT